jgi:tripartite ATP-independent transporter DctP family solute receptor
VFNMPFVFRDVDHMRKVVDGEIGQEILDAITDSDFNMVGLAWMEAGSRSLYTKKPVRKIEDLKGMKIRVIGNPLFIDTLNAMGANGIAMDTGEIFSALQSGVIDGAENNSPTLLEHNHFRVAKYYTQTHHLILPEPLLMSKTTWNKLTAEQQALVKKLAKEAQQEERELWTAKEKASDEKLKAAGVEYIEVDTKPFYDATAPVREKYGAQFADLIKRIEAVK